MFGSYKRDSVDNLIEEILSSKTQRLHNRIKELGKLIEDRRKINKKVLTELGQEILKAKTLAMRGSPTTLEDHITDPQSEHEALKLEKTKILERVELWRDIKELRKELIYLEEKLNELERQNELLRN